MEKIQLTKTMRHFPKNLYNTLEEKLKKKEFSREDSTENSATGTQTSESKQAQDVDKKLIK